MAQQGSATAIGLTELRTAVEQFPAAVTAALRAVAWRKSREVYARAKTALIAQQKTPSRKLANAMEIIEEPENNQFLVLSQAPPDQPAGLPGWIERGTSKMSARPYMRPAADAVQPSYVSEMTATAIAVAERELK